MTARSPAPRWPQDAACVGMPFTVFAPWPCSQGPSDQDPQLAVGAKRVCNRCPFKARCLEECDPDDLVAVRGGLTPAERYGVTVPKHRCSRCGGLFRSPQALGSHQAKSLTCRRGVAA